MSAVVVGIDGSEGSRAALVHALREAVRDGASVTAVVAYPAEEIRRRESDDLLPFPQDLARVEVDRAREFVDATVATVRARGGAVPPVEVTGAIGSPAVALTEAARDAARLVVGHRGRGALRSALLGSTGLGCVQRAVCPVTVVPRATLGTIDPGPAPGPAAEVGS